MYEIHVKRRFLPGYRKIKAISYKIEDALNYGGREVPIPNPRMSVYLPSNRVLVIPDILHTEWSVNIKGDANGSQEIRGGTGPAA